MNTVKRRETFISYSRKDKDFALEFAREMKSAGYLVWLDQLDIPTGARWDDEVEKALRECEIFLIILTTASVSSDNVKDEIGYAIDHSKRIMPVLLEKCDIPLRLRRFQYVDFTKVEFNEGIKRTKQLLETLLTEQSAPVITINPEFEPQKASDRKVTPAPSLLNKNKPVQRRWMGVGVGILSCATCLAVLGTIIVFRDFIFPSTPTQLPAAIETIIQTATEVPTNTPSQVPPSPVPLTAVPTTAVPPAPVPPTISPSIPWTIDTVGVCRDDKGDYPRWSDYSWTISQCKDACQNNPNCQGFAMSKEKNYCQLFGSDGQHDGNGSSTYITHGDSSQAAYTCFIKR